MQLAPLDITKTLIASTPAFIAKCTTESLTPADQVYVQLLRPALEGEVDHQTALARPYAIVKWEEFEWQEESTQCMQPRGQIKILISDKMRGSSFDEQVRDFITLCEGITTHVAETAYENNSLIIRSLRLHHGPEPVERRHESDEHKFFIAEYTMVLGADFS